jgi:hypothetical protein
MGAKSSSTFRLARGFTGGKQTNVRTAATTEREKPRAVLMLDLRQGATVVRRSLVPVSGGFTPPFPTGNK